MSSDGVLSADATGLPVNVSSQTAFPQSPGGPGACAVGSHGLMQRTHSTEDTVSCSDPPEAAGAR